MRPSLMMAVLGGVLSSVIAFNPAFAVESKVKITQDMAHSYVTHKGQKVRIQRIQDTENRLIDDFAKTSRPCPPFCIHPMSAAPGIETVGELEVIHFLKDEVETGKGILIDARMPKWYVSETIPGSINIPFVVFKKENPYMEKILSALGGTQDASGKWQLKDARSLILFCNGPWCDQSPRAIEGLLEVGYPAHKIKYYRGGMNLWRLMGLTTVVSKKSVSE